MGMSVNLVRVALWDRRAHTSAKARAAFGLFAFACACGLGLIGLILISKAHSLLARDFTFGIALASVTTAAATFFSRSGVGRVRADAGASIMSDRRSPIISGCSGDSLFVLESVYSETGALVDFRFIYPNSHDALGSSGIQAGLAGKLLYADSPLEKSSWLYEKCKTVVETGKVFTHEVSTAKNPDASWLRYRVVKFNDGVAVSITEIGSNFSATRNLAFDKAFTISSPFAIIAVNLDGVVSEMNPAAERMLWYDKDEVVGRKSLFTFHDSAGGGATRCRAKSGISRPSKPRHGGL